MSNISQPRMFLQDITVVDCAVLMGKPNLKSIKFQGLSFRVSVVVAGELNGDEQVIEDFSTFKKRAKEVIDGKMGPDHKLLVAGGFVSTTGSGVFRAWKENSNHWKIYGCRPMYPVIEGPADMVWIYAAKELPDFSKVDFRDLSKSEGQNFLDRIAAQIKQLLCDRLKLDIVEVHLDATPTTHHMLGGKKVKTYPFSYTHGLPHSTSYGCQNVMHGHLSFIRIAANFQRDQKLCNMLARELAKDMDGLYFANREHSTSPRPNCDKTIFYKTKDRGEFRANLNCDEHLDIWTPVEWLDVETTVENLVDYVAKRARKILRKLAQSTDNDPMVELARNFNSAEIFLSEGLQKGACIEISGPGLVVDIIKNHSGVKTGRGEARMMRQSPKTSPESPSRLAYSMSEVDRDVSKDPSHIISGESRMTSASGVMSAAYGTNVRPEVVLIEEGKPTVEVDPFLSNRHLQRG